MVWYDRSSVLSPTSSASDKHLDEQKFSPFPSSFVNVQIANCKSYHAQLDTSQGLEKLAEGRTCSSSGYQRKVTLHVKYGIETGVWISMILILKMIVIFVKRGTEERKRTKNTTLKYVNQRYIRYMIKYSV